MADKPGLLMRKGGSVDLDSRGTRRYIDFQRAYQEAAIGGFVPTQEPGVNTEVIDDDGSIEFDEAYATASRGKYGVWDDEPGKACFGRGSNPASH